MENQLIRVMQVIPDMRSGGAENFIMNLYRKMNKDEIQFDFSVHYKERRFFDDEIESYGGKIYRFSLRNDNSVIKYMRDLNRFYKNHPEYKLVHCHWNSMGFIHLLVAKHNKIKVRIGHSHNSSAGIGRKGKIKKWLVKPYKYVTTLNLACSDASGKFLWGKRPFEFIPNAIDVNRFRFSEEARNRVRREWNLPDDAVLLGHVGRFNVQKNHKQLIAIFNEVVQNNKNCYLMLIGEGELSEQIENLVSEYNLKDKVIFAGVHSNMQDYYSAMDAFLLPSLYEGLPLTAVEAQASGLPTLLSDTITTEVKINDNVYYLNNNSAKDWCEKIDALKHNRQKRLDYNNTVLKSVYNIDELAKKISDLYKKLYNEQVNDKS